MARVPAVGLEFFFLNMNATNFSDSQFKLLRVIKFMSQKLIRCGLRVHNLNIIIYDKYNRV